MIRQIALIQEGYFLNFHETNGKWFWELECVHGENMDQSIVLIQSPDDFNLMSEAVEHYYKWVHPN